MTLEEQVRNYKNILRSVLQRYDTCYYCQQFGIDPTTCSCRKADDCINRMLNAPEKSHQDQER